MGYLTLLSATEGRRAGFITRDFVLVTSAGTLYFIALGIGLADCIPLEGSVTSRAAEAIAGATGTPVCFLVERVRFRLDEIGRDPLP